MGKKLSNGPNARPRDKTIAQSGGGLPDDSSRVSEEVSETDVAAARHGLEKIGQPQAKKDKAAEREQSTEVGPGTAAGRTQVAAADPLPSRQFRERAADALVQHAPPAEGPRQSFGL